MQQTGVFYHEIMRCDHAPMDMDIGKAYDALNRAGFTAKQGVTFFEAGPVADELVLEVHSREWAAEVKRQGYWEVGLYSAGAVVMAFDKVLSGELRNALSLVGIGGHHARRDYAWGGCYVNHEAIAITWARQNHRAGRFTVVDTDTHHGDGTRELFLKDQDVQHICYCGYGRGDGKTKVCLPHASSDDEFVRRFRDEVPPLIRAFRPDLVLWFCGLDTHVDSYGTQALTEHCYPRLCRVLMDTAGEVCEGRIVVRVGCNAPAHAAGRVLPGIVRALSADR